MDLKITIPFDYDVGWQVLCDMFYNCCSYVQFIDDDWILRITYKYVTIVVSCCLTQAQFQQGYMWRIKVQDIYTPAYLMNNGILIKTIHELVEIISMNGCSRALRMNHL